MVVRDSDGFGRGSDSGGFGRMPSSPAGEYFAVLYSLYGLFDPTESGSGFERIWWRAGFGVIPGPQIWKSPTQKLRAGLGEGGTLDQKWKPPSRGPGVKLQNDSVRADLEALIRYPELNV